LKENYGETYRWLDEFLARSTPTEKMEGLVLVGFYDFLLGRLEKSLSGILAVRKIGESYGQDFIIANMDRMACDLYAELGRYDEARKAYASYREYHERTLPDQKELRAFAYANELGRVDLKQGRLKDARARVEENKALLPALPKAETAELFDLRYRILDAEVSLAEGSPEAALAAAEKMRLMNFPGMNAPNMIDYNIPLEKDVIARAYWKKGDLDAAVAEYRKLMTVDPKNQFRYLIHPLYHYRLGRILEEKGDKTGASMEYRKFIEFWKDADKIFPEPADARKRLAALNPAPR
jgi:tetratricopeptide (TPR) repeat protein